MTSRHLCVALLLVSLAVFSSGCGLAKRGLAGMKSSKKNREKGEERKVDGTRDLYVGTIESVNPEQQFVLVRIEQRFAIAAGTQLETRTPSGLRARLVAGSERKLNFLAADIVDGLPHAGDVVVLPAGSPALVPPGTSPGTPGAPATPGKLEPIPTTQPQPSTGVYASPLPAGEGGSSYYVPGVPAGEPIPGVPPQGYPAPVPVPRANPR